MSLGSIVYFYLFYRARYIPRGLAAAGMGAFLLTLVFPFVDVVWPYESLMILGVPAILIEITIGLWLLIRGIRLPLERNESTGMALTSGSAA